MRRLTTRLPMELARPSKQPKEVKWNNLISWANAQGSVCYNCTIGRLPIANEKFNLYGAFGGDDDFGAEGLEDEAPIGELF